MINRSEGNIISNGGTPAFMAPEVCGGEKHLGWPADVWAFGVTMYLLAVGHLPFYARKVCVLCILHNTQYNIPADFDCPIAMQFVLFSFSFLKCG
jgi:serine/threonine protein kinase